MTPKDGVEDGLFTAELAVKNTDNVALYCIDNGDVLNDDAIVIKKDGTEISRVYLHDYKYAIDKAQEISSRGSTAGKIDVQEFRGRAQLLNFKLDTDGSWDAIIATCSYIKVRCEYKGYPPNDGQPHYDDEDFRRAWKVVEVDPQHVYYGTAYTERNHLVLFGSNDTFDDYVQKTRDKFSEIGFDDIHVDLTPYIERNARGVGTVATILHYGEKFVDIAPPDGTPSTERSISTCYILHVNSKDNIKILYEHIDAPAFRMYDDERYVFNEIPVPANVNDVDFYWSVRNNQSELPITHVLGYALGLTDPFATNSEIFEVRVKYFLVEKRRPILFEDDAINVHNYLNTWPYPLQDNYFCQMNFWRFYHIYNPDGDSIVINLAQSSTDKGIDLIVEGFKFVKEDFDTVRWFLENGFQLPYIVLPAVVPLKKGGYLIGVPQHRIYEVDDNGVAKLITGKNVLANLRLRYMSNISKAKH